MSASGGGGFFNQLNPRGARGGGAPGGHQGKGPGGRDENHPRPQVPGGGRRGVSFEDSTEYDFSDDDRYLYEEGNTPHGVYSARLNTKLGGTLFSIRMVPLPQTMMPGDLCPHLKMLGMGIKARVYTLL